MKNTIISIVLLIAIIGGCIYSNYFTRKTTTDILDTLDMCEEAVTEEDWETAMDHVYLTNALWNHYRPIYSAFLRHDELTQITQSLSRVTMLVTIQNRDDFYVENGFLCELIESVAGLDRSSMENIL